MKFRPKKLDIYITRQFGLLFLGTFFICQFVLMMQFLFIHVDDLIGKGLSLGIMAKFFWYLGLMLVPEALPLAILLSAIITFGNLGESSELTAIKSAGISLMQTFRALILVCILISLASFYFQNNIGPASNVKIGQLMLSIKQKSPELEIPEGIFYDGIPNCNLYVEKKDMNTGKLYGIMIYRMTGSYEDQAIILADSGMLQATADKKHLLLTLWSGEWFENMRSQELAGSAAVPYRRETFTSKQVVQPYDGDLNMVDAAGFSNKARGKSLAQLAHGKDSLELHYDSLGMDLGREFNQRFYQPPIFSREDSLRAVEQALNSVVRLDTIYDKMEVAEKSKAVNRALQKVQSEISELSFRSMLSKDGDRQIREHQMEMINKFTLALSCIIFFFVGAPLGAITRKGGIGIPVIIAVVVYIFYVILNQTGYRMARGGMWTVPFGKALAPAVLTPLAVFVTYKANNDSGVFNLDLYKDLFRRALGLRIHRYVPSKEVVMERPDYPNLSARLANISDEVTQYAAAHNLKKAPNVKKVFFQYEPDHEIERIVGELESAIEELSNSRDKVIIHQLNDYPIVSEKAHTRPFERKWMNIMAAIIVPAGLFFYLRMWMFRLRLWGDLKKIKQTNSNIIERIAALPFSTAKA